MQKIRFISMPTERAKAYWEGAKDAYGQTPEVHISKGDGAPCRHCQQDVERDEKFLILADCPFPKSQPFAETGPIFLHADPCPRYPENDQIPDMFLKRDSYLLKGYSSDDRIIYGTGQIVKSPDIAEAASAIFQQNSVEYVHVRSALNNCFACRIDRTE